MSWLLAFAGFAVLIILHEFGHFVAAKAVGMRVERFFLFFPPKLFSVRRGETEYGIGAIPLGGFVKITGMNPEEELDEEIAPRGYYHQPVWKRIVVIAAGPFVNLVIAFVILFGLGFTLEEPTALAVGAVEKDTPAAAELEPGDRLISIDGVRRGDGSAEAQADRLTASLGGLECSGDLSDGCAATEAIPVLVARDGRRTTLEMRPFYDAAAERFRFGFSFEGIDFVPSERSIPSVGRVRRRPDVGGDLGDGLDRRADLRRRAARADLGRRRLLRGDTAGDRVRHPSGAAGARP